MKVEKVMEVRDRTLCTNYEPHDVLQGYLEANLAARGYSIKQYGDDNRDHDGDNIVYGESPDVAVYNEDDELVCYIEVKSKRVSNHEWFGRLNKSSFEECLQGESDATQHESDFEGARNIDEDVLIYFGVVDESIESVDDDTVSMRDPRVIRDGFIPVDEDADVESMDGFRSHGNIVVCLDEADTRNYNWFERQLDSL